MFLTNLLTSLIFLTNHRLTELPMKLTSMPCVTGSSPHRLLNVKAAGPPSTVSIHFCCHQQDYVLSKYQLYLFSNQFMPLSLIRYCCSVMSDSLRPHGLQHARLPCPSPSPPACSDSCPLVMPSNHLILCRPLLLLPSVFPSIRLFSSHQVA